VGDVAEIGEVDARILEAEDLCVLIERPAIHGAARGGWEARTGSLAAMRFALRGTS